jgi:DNA invertase Pin-like site-specific DNA recombinase
MMRTVRKYAAALTPARPSEYLASLNDLKPGTPVVLYARESDPTQKDNLPGQIAKLKREVAKRGHPAKAVVKEIARGAQCWRDGLKRAFVIARRASATVVAESVTRFKRNHDPRAPLTVADLKQLMAEANGVPLATVVHPDAAPEQARSYQSKRGMAGKGRYGGRPTAKHPKKARRVKNMPTAVALRQGGMSLRAIGREIKVAFSTVRDWLQK